MAEEKTETTSTKIFDAAETLVNELLGKKIEVGEIEEAKADLRDVEIKELKTELEEYRNKYVRLFADFDNFKKRTAKEKLELTQTAGKDVIKDLLPVIDDFERAMKAIENNPEPVAAKEGMRLIYNKLATNLSAKGLKQMESPIGKEFDVEMHEAITEIPAPKPELVGRVVDEVEKGYHLNGKLIRFAKVVVGKP